MNDIKKAIESLKNGHVVGIPTETVYGLAASINSPEGIKNIFATKERPFFDPLIVHVSSIEEAKKYTKIWTPLIQKLAQTYWPGALTLILPKNELVDDMITSGHDTVGLRIPNHPVALDLIESLGHPVAAPSANKFKKTSPTSAEHVRAEFPNILTLEGGESPIGIESTIVGIDGDKVLIYRPGMISLDDIKECLKEFNTKVSLVESPISPGHLKHHYMPITPIILSANFSISKILEDVPKELLENSYTWIFNDSPEIIARELYGKLRKLDKANYTAINIVIPDAIEKESKWDGIINRVIKASRYKK